MALYFVLGDHSRNVLEGMSPGLVRNALITAVRMLILGVKIIGDAINGLSS